ncbi:hypothetical protein [Fluviicola taffensis]|uniref:Uncharacterized protein n=1 Tax=Fluviicola taffensis (strain DSM 16823 / NCIMB 13979 / RW262) TaxID=755732 RepID=F2IAX7_FLUTR|nr:hypothetical protein [Fluviicola taffensis]AEA45301.1 hypothetical protein Fluta_3329 [Fluviicola taffensis DSM 16823]
MKRTATILSIVFVIALLWKDIAAFSWNVWFYNNQVELAAKYCVNKKKPMLHCDGKCYLAKQLKKLEQEEQKNQPVPKMPLKLKENVWTADAQIILAFETSTIELLSEKATIFFYLNKELISYSGSTFHPPSLG